MGKPLVRILEIVLDNFKNVEKGEIIAGSSENLLQGKSDVLGIYGQNGSGKTAAVDAIHLMQRLVVGEKLPRYAEEFIRQGADCASVSILFFIQSGDIPLEFEYTYTLGRKDDICCVSAEKIAYYSYKEDVRQRRKTAFQCDILGDDNRFYPVRKYEKYIKQSEKNLVDFAVAKKMAAANRSSLLFSKEGYGIFSKDYLDDKVSLGLKALRYYMFMKLFVITNREIGAINMQMLVPISFTQQDMQHINTGKIPVALQGTSLIPVRIYQVLTRTIEPINQVLTVLVPGIRVEIEDHGRQLMDDGAEGRKIELVSVRNDVRIPLRCESAGVIKIISMLNALVAMYNDKSVGLIVDELDSGVFEYLLGNLLEIIEKNGKGQLLFTSHNLRILETVSKESVLFTTTNPRHRYIRLTNVKETNNVRDMYLRSLSIGGQKEPLCEIVDIYAIGHAFRKAGRELVNEYEN